MAGHPRYPLEVPGHPHRSKPDRPSRRTNLAVLGILCLCPAAALSQQTRQIAWADLPDAPSATLPQASGTPAAQPASNLTGTVSDADGALVAGATIVLSRTDGAPTLQTTSAADGQFAFPGIPPGSFTLLVTLPGFVPSSTSGTLVPGQSLLAPITLRLASVNVEVTVTLTQAEIAEEQIRTEEKQRLIGFLPNFYVTYEWHAVPLTPRQKFELSWKNASDPANLFVSSFVAGIQQATNSFPGYGQGAQGYGKRLGANLGDLVTGTFVGGAILPTLFHQDPRYFYKGTGTFRSRFFYAISRSVVCRGDNGHNQPAFASVLGDLSAGAISNIYYPASDRHGAALTIKNGFLGVLGDAANGVAQEFVVRHLTPSANRKPAAAPPDLPPNSAPPPTGAP